MQPVADAAASASADVDVRQHESALSATTSTASVAQSSAQEEDTSLAMLNYDGLNLNHEDDNISNESDIPAGASVFDTAKESTSAAQLLNQNSTTLSTTSPPVGIESIAVEDGRPPNPTSSMNARESNPDNNMKEQPTDELLLVSMLNAKEEQPADLLTQTASTVTSSCQWEESTLVTLTSMSSSSQTVDVVSEQSPVTGLATLLMPTIGRELIDKDEEPSILFGTTAQTAEDVADTSTPPTDAYRSNSPAPPPPAEDFEDDIRATDLATSRATSRLDEIERLMNESFNPYPSSNSKLEIIDDDDIAQDMLRSPSLMNDKDDDKLLSKNSKLEIIDDDDNVQYMFRSPWIEGNGSDTSLTRKMKRSIIFGDKSTERSRRLDRKGNEDDFVTNRKGESDGIIIVGHRVDDADESCINVEGSDDDVITTAAVAHLSDADERNSTVLIPEAFLVDEDMVEERRTEQVFVATYLKPPLPWWKQRIFN